MSSEKRWKRLFFRWTAPKGFTTMALFSALAIVTEYVLVRFFSSFGLVDKSLFTETLQVPLTNLFFTITVSPLFHLIPLGVVVVLVSSWMHLTKYVAVVPHRIEPVKRPLTTRKRRYPRTLEKRFKPIRRFSRGIGRRLRRVSRALKGLYRRTSTAVLRIRGVSYVTQRLFFARAAVKSAATILTVFLASIFVLYALVHPSLIHNMVVGFYAENPSFLGFVLETNRQAREIGQVLSPIGWLASSINGALVAVAPGFRSSFESFGAPIAGPIAKLDLVWKYALCQNAAAWFSAIAAFAYGQYTSRLYRRKP
ncbi:MAG: hypothetical protein ACE5OW_01920 [Candidatus Bathyarchaeia archaeon]